MIILISVLHVILYACMYFMFKHDVRVRHYWARLNHHGPVKALYESKLTYHQWGLVGFSWGQLKNAEYIIHCNVFDKYTSKNSCISTETIMLTLHLISYRSPWNNGALMKHLQQLHKRWSLYIDGLVQERHHSSALAMELHFSFTNL